MEKLIPTLFEYIGLRKGDLIPILCSSALFYLMFPVYWIGLLDYRMAELFSGNAVIASALAGYFLFQIYRRVLGETVLFPLIQETCFALDKVLQKMGAAPGGDYLALSKLGVGVSHLRPAYNAVRNEYLSDLLREKLRVQHAEVHPLYLVALYLLAAHATQIQSGYRPTSELLIGASFFLTAVIIDIRQHAAAALAFSSDPQLLERLKTERSPLFYSSNFGRVGFLVAIVVRVMIFFLLIFWLIGSPGFLGTS